MAWRPNEYLIEGILDNTKPRLVTGWMRYLGLNEDVTLKLEGDFHRDIRGTKIHFSGLEYIDANQDEARSYMSQFSTRQTGVVGDITAGLPPQDYVSHPYVEWYSEQNGRVVLEPNQMRVEGRPIPACESDPISRATQSHNMIRFLAGFFGYQIPAPKPQDDPDNPTEDSSPD